jgi:hypothetical protein
LIFLDPAWKRSKPRLRLQAYCDARVAELDEKFAERRAKLRAMRKASYEKWSNGPKGEAYREAQKAKRIKI